MTATYDFVVVGGGSSGCIVAAELAGAGRSVLLLESGERAEDNPETLRADGYKDAFINDRLMHERFTLPQPRCGGRKLFAGTGRGIGGSGAINAMVYTRGAREDYDAWGDDWRWEDVAGDFRSLESKLRPNQRPATEFTRACIRGAAEQGMRESRDLNDGNLKSVLGHEWMNFEGEARRNAYVAFIKDRRPERLTVETRAHATKLRFEGRRCVGVAYRVGDEQKEVRASGEVVLCAGALATPVLLLASGVGPATELRSVGVDVVLDVPGVGRNLHDHPNVTLFFLAHREVDCFYPQLYGFDRMRPGDGPSDSCFVFYPARSSFKEGMMRMLPAMVLPESTYRAGTAVRWMRKAISAGFAPGLVRGFVDRMWGIVVILGKPRSRGTIRLGPSSDVRIDPQYLTHPDDLDAMIAGVRHARRIAGSSALSELGSRELIPGIAAGPDRDSRGSIERFLSQNLMTTYHFAGTCKMGEEAASVVDRRLRVRGLEGLRVCDASIIPETPVAALNAPSMLIGLRGARRILEDHG